MEKTVILKFVLCGSILLSETTKTYVKNENLYVLS